MSMMMILAGLLAAAQTAPDAGPIEILGTHFYARDARLGDAGIREADTVPLRAGTSCFGWVLQVTPRPDSVAIREELQLPGPATDWSGDDPSRTVTVSGDRSTGTTRFETSLAEGILTQDWCIAEGDPAGPYRIRVYHGDRLLHEFRFTVVPEAD